MSDPRGSTATPERGRPAPDKSPRAGLWARLGLFFRQVVAELRKVIWPTRRDLISYTTVVLVFVLAVTAIVALLDFVFGQLMLAIFG